VTVYDISGRIVSSTMMSKGSGTIDLSTLMPGTYLVRAGRIIAKISL